MNTVTARYFGKRHIHIHNDLANAAFYYRNLIDHRLANEDRKGIAFDMLSCLIFLAFSFEATLNFFGNSLVPKWKERQPFDAKVKEVLETVKLVPDLATRPYRVIAELNSFRILMARGKPVQYAYDEVTEVPKEELERPWKLTGEWEKCCTVETVHAYYEDIDAVIKAITEASGISPYEMPSRDESSLDLLE